MLSKLATSVVIVSIFFPVLAGITIALRFFGQRKKSAPFHAEAYFIVLAWVFSTGLAVTDIYGAYNGGIGVPFEDVTMAQLTVFNKVLFAQQFLYLFAVAAVKGSLLLFYKRIFIMPKFKMAVNVMLAVIGGWLIAFFFCTLFQIMPISANWTGTGTFLLNERSMYLALAITDLILDLAILCLPIPVIKSLHVSNTKKAAVMLIFGLGFFCVIASAIRIYYVVCVLGIVDGAVGTYSRSVALWLVWSQVESCWSIVCCCLPTLGPLFSFGRSAESMVASVRSIFSVRSGSSISASEKRSPSLDSRWNDPTATKSMANTRASHNDEPDEEPPMPGHIKVKTHMSRSEEDQIESGKY